MIIQSFRVIAFLVLAFIIGVFAFVNHHLVEIDLFPLPYVIEMPLFLAVVIGIIFGCLASVLLYLPKRMRYAMKVHGQKKQIQALQDENKGLQVQKEASVREA